jgi:RNA polymerase II subunit A-like phosphatase
LATQIANDIDSSDDEPKTPNVETTIDQTPVETTNQTPVEATTHQTPAQYTPKAQDPDNILPTIKNVLVQVHEEYYKHIDLDVPGKPDVAKILTSLKSEVLEDCCLVFSGVIPLQTAPEKSSIWRMATSFGARCVHELTGKVTHLVAATIGTSKVNTARKYNTIKIVSPSWLTTSAWEWKKQDEMDYIMTPPNEGSTESEVENPEEAALEFEDDGLDIDWDDSSVDAALGDDDDDEVAEEETKEEEADEAEKEEEVEEEEEEDDEDEDDDDWLAGQLADMDEDPVPTKRKRDDEDEDDEVEDEHRSK